MQVCSHAGVLASLPAEEESDRAVTAFVRSRENRRPLRLREGLDGLRHVAGSHGAPMWEKAATDLECPFNILEAGLWVR
jgi:hypothetical protein